MHIVQTFRYMYVALLLLLSTSPLSTNAQTAESSTSAKAIFAGAASGVWKRPLKRCQASSP